MQTDSSLLRVLCCPQVLLAHGAAVDAVELKGRTPLHHAAYAGHAACVHVLLRHGASLEAADG